MKHKYLLSGILLAGLMLLSGCENNFDAKIYGELSTTNFPQTASDYESYMMDCYIPFTSYWGYSWGGNQQRPFYIPTDGTIRLLDVPSDLLTAGAELGFT